MALINFKEKIDLSGFILVIPSVSVGNVPQLTIDLLITTLKFKNVATVWHPGLVASVGSDPFYFDTRTICTACELYVNEEKKIATLQLRSTIETKLMLKFFTDLMESFNTLKVNKVIILATGFDYELHNISEKDRFYFASNTNDKEHIAKTTLAKHLERNSNGKLFVSGSGFAIKLYEVLNNAMTCTLIVKYVSEGENIFDAQICLKKLLQFVGVCGDIKISYPSSWSYVYGGPPPIGVF